MLIVAGTLTVDPAQRDELLRQLLPSTIATRDDPGCLEHVLSLDPVDPAQLLVYERWETADDLDRHLAATRTGPDRGEAEVRAVPVIGVDLFRYEVSAASPLHPNRSSP